MIRRDAGGTSQYFTYNSEHQLLHVRSVRRSAVGVESEQTYFAYDALGRRIAKRSSGNVTRFVWDGMRLLQERRKGLASTYVYEENAQKETYAPLARLDTPAPIGVPFGKPTLTENTPSAQFYYFHLNTSGQPEELTDADGKVVWQARYAAWGQIVYEKSAPGIQQNLRFQGQYFDSETGLCYNTFRYYDPGLGRFFTEDPIGLSGGINLYQYGPNPLMWIDPWGWTPCQPYEVGRYKDLKKRSVSGDGLDIHHVVQAHPAEQIIPGYNRNNGIAIALPRQEHKNIPTLKGKYKGNIKKLLKKDIDMIKKHTNAPQSSIDKLIKMNKNDFPNSF